MCPPPPGAANDPPNGEDKEKEREDVSAKEKGVVALSHTTLMRFSRESSSVNMSVCV